MWDRKFSHKILVSFIALTYFIAGCSDVRLSKLKEPAAYVTSEGEFCTQPPDMSSHYTKFMFLVDKSGSNVDGNLGGPPTDPNNKMRADNIEKFWQTKKNNPFMKWSFVAFHDWQADSYIGPQDKPIFSGDPKDMQNALAQQRNNPDQNSTPYQAALLMAEKIVKDDLKAHPDEESDYMLFFISDGYPDDGNVTHPVSDAELAMVDNLMNTAKGHLHLSTAYYGPNDPKASGGLKQMADRGQGRFVDFNVTGSINLDDLIVGGPSAEPYMIKPGSLIAYNVNSAICFDGAIGTDSDGDGLCDRDELSLGSPYNPQNRFSFGDGYGDYIHYAAKIAHDTLIPCTDRTDEDHDLLTKCEESYMKNNNPTGTTMGTADPLNFDTDGDGVIDGVEYFMLHLKSVAMDKFNLFKNFDSEAATAWDQIRQHRNPLFPDANLINTDAYDTRAEFKGYNAEGQSCYRFSQTKLRTYPTLAVNAAQSLGAEYAHEAGGNVVLLHFIETLQRDPASTGLYAYSLQTVLNPKGGNGAIGSGLTVNDKAFRVYKVPSGH